MASFFKGSCIIFWLIWLGCMAYFFATTIFTTTYLMSSAASTKVSDILMTVCFFNVGMAFVGCAFVKCSISHVLCAALYILPIIGVNMAFCIMGIVAVRSLVVHTPEELVQEISRVFNEEKRYPVWIFNMQEELPCCGIFSYLDYPLIFNQSTNLSFVVPKSCCEVSPKRDQAHCTADLDVVAPLVLDSMNLLIPDPNITATFQRASEILALLEGRCISNMSITASAPYRDSQIRFTNLDNVTDKVFTCGCYDDIKAMEESIHQSHFIFFLIILFASFGMASVYTKVWCKNTGTTTDTGSDHSLDVDPIPSVHHILEVQESIELGKPGVLHDHHEHHDHRVLPVAKAKPAPSPRQAVSAIVHAHGPIHKK